MAFEQPIDPIYEGAWEIVKDTNAATSGAREVEQGRFRRKLYLMVAGMSLGGRWEAGSAHTTAARKKGSEAPLASGAWERTARQADRDAPNSG